MGTPLDRADLAALWRLLMEHAEATQEDHDATQALADTFLAGACDLAVEARCDNASIRKIRAERALAAFTRATAAAPAELAPDMDAIEIEQCPIDLCPLDNGGVCVRCHATPAEAIAEALAARDERIAKLEAGLVEACDEMGHTAACERLMEPPDAQPCSCAHGRWRALADGHADAARARTLPCSCCREQVPMREAVLIYHAALHIACLPRFARDVAMAAEEMARRVARGDVPGRTDEDGKVGS